MGEDPYLVAMLGAAYVRGLQSAGVIATLKHFAGYSASRAARNHGPVSMGRRELHGHHPAAVRDGRRPGRRRLGDELLLRRGRRPGGRGLAGCSPTCCATSGDSPAPSSPTTGRCRSSRRCTASPRTPTRPARMALAAGIDVELPDTLGFGAGLVERVRRGELPEALVDRAARRLLTQKVQLGLLDPDWTPEGSVAGAAAVDLDSPGQPRPGPGDGRAVGRPARRRHRAAAARRRTPGAAPGGRRRAVRRRPAHVHGLLRLPQPRAAPPPGSRARHRGADRGRRAARPSCRTPRSSTSRAATCRETTGPASPPRSPRAREADLCVAVVGDLAGLFGLGTSGEGCDAEDLRLPGVQADLLAELLQTGTPVVVVVVSGRPYALGDVHGRAAGLVQAFMPGEEGGPAIAGVLSGRVQPGGKLPVQIPQAARRAAGHLPAAAARRPTATASATSTRPRCSRSATAPPTPPSRSTTCGSATPRCPPTASSPSRSGSATPGRGPARRSSSSTCTTWSPR